MQLWGPTLLFAKRDVANHGRSSLFMNDDLPPRSESSQTGTALGNPHPCGHLSRRQFIKRTVATALVTVFALNALAEEESAEASGSSSVKRYPIDVTEIGSNPNGTGGTYRPVIGGQAQPLHSISISMTADPDDPNEVQPAPSQTVNYTIRVTEAAQQANGQFVEVGTTDIAVACTVANPNFPKAGKITWSASGAGTYSVGDFVIGVQIVVTADDGGANFSITAKGWHVASPGYDGNVVHNASLIASNIAPAMYLENEEQNTVVNENGTPIIVVGIATCAMEEIEE
jgi:hypothetical protein